LKKLILIALIGLHGVVVQADWSVDMKRRVYVWEKMPFGIDPKHQIFGKKFCLDHNGNPVVLDRQTIMHQDGRIFVWAQKSEQDVVRNLYGAQKHTELKEILQSISQRAYQEWVAGRGFKSHM